MNTESRHDNYLRGALLIMLSAFCFACMNVCVRLAGDIPSVQKSFFRNLVAAAFAGAVIIKNHVPLRVEKEARLCAALPVQPVFYVIFMPSTICLWQMLRY